MNTVTRKLALLILIFTLCLSLPYTVHANNGWDYMAGELRVDLPIVSNSRDYSVMILANGPANTWDPTSSTTSAWLAVYIPVFFR